MCIGSPSQSGGSTLCSTRHIALSHHCTVPSFSGGNRTGDPLILS